jgi:hypothetical protein
MPFTATADDQALDALADVAPSTNLIAYASLHSAYSATGANELTGGSPAYARVALSWSAAAGSSKSLSATPSAFNVPGSSAVAWIGMWSAATGGTFTGMGANGAATQYVFTAATSGNLFTAPGSGYSNGQAVVLFPGAGGTTPGGFTAGTIYYVVSVSGATFELAATSGGSAITVSAAGSGLVQAITLETFGAQGFFTINADTLSLV